MATAVDTIDQSLLTVEPMPTENKSTILHNYLQAVTAPSTVKAALSSILDAATNKLYQKISHKQVSVQPQSSLDDSYTEKIDSLLKSSYPKDARTSISTATYKSHSISSNFTKYDPDIIKMKEQEAKEFVAKMKKEKEYRVQYFKSLEQKEADKIQKEKEVQRQLEKMKTEECQIKRKEMIKANFEKCRVMAEERRKTIQERLLARVVNSHYLYKDWEKNYEDKSKEDFEKKLSLNRELCKELYKPLNRSEFDEHYKKIESLRLQQQLEVHNKVKQKNEDFSQRKQLLERLKTKTSEKVVRQMDEEKCVKNKHSQERVSLKMKMRAYSHIVKETRSPSINPKKAEERIQNINRLKMTKRQQKDKKDLPDYLHSVCNENFKNNMSEKDKESISDRSLPIIEKKSYPDYLKAQREQREKEGRQIKKYDWENDIKSSNQDRHQKYDNVISKAKALEEVAKREEGILKAKGGHSKDLKLGEHISDMLIDAIKAKLAVLGEL